MSPLLAGILADARTLEAEGDELHVLRLVLDRLLLGRRGYGPLRVDDPARSWPVERAFELVDATMYGAFELVKLQRAARIDALAVPAELGHADTIGSGAPVAEWDEPEISYKDDASDPTWDGEGPRLARERLERRSNQ